MNDDIEIKVNFGFKSIIFNRHFMYNLVLSDDSDITAWMNAFKYMIFITFSFA